MIYNTQGVCSSQIDLEIDSDGIITAVSFMGGCNGNLKGISALVIGQKAIEVAEKLRSITCGLRQTSCPAQLALAINEALRLNQTKVNSIAV